MKKQGILHWLIIAALGIFLIVGHNAAANIIVKVIAVALILFAVAGTWDWWKMKSTKQEAIAKLLGNVVFCLAGLWILTSTAKFISLINVVLGVVIAATSALSLYRGFKDEKNKVTMVLSAIGLALGIVIVCAKVGTTWLTMAEGIGLVYSSITGFIGEQKNDSQNSVIQPISARRILGLFLSRDGNISG